MLKTTEKRHFHMQHQPGNSQPQYIKGRGKKQRKTPGKIKEMLCVLAKNICNAQGLRAQRVPVGSKYPDPMEPRVQSKQGQLNSLYLKVNTNLVPSNQGSHCTVRP